MVKIFISYRRDDSAASAGRIYDSLMRYFGKNAVFFDTESISSGSSFPEALTTEIHHCDVFLAVIGNNWKGYDTAKKSYRIDDLQDWVHYELWQAITLNKKIIPILIDDAAFPSGLPSRLQSLSSISAEQVHNNKYFHTDISNLCAKIDDKYPNRGLSPYFAKLLIVLLFLAVLVALLFTFVIRPICCAPIKTIEDLSTYTTVQLVQDDVADFAWLSDIPEQTAPSLLKTSIDGVSGTFVTYPVELRSVLNDDDYSEGRLEGRLEREMRDSERANFHALLASIYIESALQKDVYVIPYIASEAFRTIQLGFGEVIPTNQWTLITWRDVVDSTQYNDTFISDLESFYERYLLADLGFIRLSHVLSINKPEDTEFGFRFRLISDAAIGQEDLLEATIYISSLTFLP